VVLLNREDWETLKPLLVAGLKLQTVRTRDTVVVVLREYDPPRQILLSKALFGGAEVRLRNGESLDLRRENLEPVRDGQTA
jgi:hypothetical protein